MRGWDQSPADGAWDGRFVRPGDRGFSILHTVRTSQIPCISEIGGWGGQMPRVGMRTSGSYTDAAQDEQAEDADDQGENHVRADMGQHPDDQLRPTL